MKPISIALLVSLEMAVQELLAARIEEMIKRGDITGPERLGQIQRELHRITWEMLHPEASE